MATLIAPTKRRVAGYNCSALYHSGRAESLSPSGVVGQQFPAMPPANLLPSYEMTYLVTRRLLEWRLELDHGWSVRPGFFGRGLRRYLGPATWAELEATYVGADRDEIWAALYRAIDLFQRVAIGVGRDLGYEYPHHLDATMMSYLGQIERLD